MANESKFALTSTNVVGLLIGLLMAVTLWRWMSSPGKSYHQTPRTFAAPTEVDRVIYAVRNARSWRVTSAGTMDGKPYQTDQDVMCPFESHTVTRIPGATGPHAIAEEFVETENRLYAHEGGQPWHSQPNGASDKCATGPMAGPVTLIGILENLKSAANVRKGPLLKFEGGTCRLWEFSGERSTNASVSSICVDDASYLPYELRVGALKVEYSNWNDPILIEIPVE